MPSKTRNIVKVIAAGTVAITLIAVIILNLGKNKDFGTLFTGLNEGEAQEVAALLQDEGIEYRFNGDGTIRVPSGQEDRARANLLSKGYPKSGFTYDMYLNNSGLMTTESDKKRVSLYELQERLAQPYGYLTECRTPRSLSQRARNKSMPWKTESSSPLPLLL